MPRTFPPAPGWSPTGHRIKAPLDYGRGPEKTWVYGALRVRDGKELTRCAASRNSKGYIALLTDIEADNPSGDIFIITDNLSSHTSLETRTWLVDHPRIHHVFIPTGACWLNLQEGGDRASHPRRDRATQSASQTLGLGTPCQGSSSLSPTLLLPHLRNLALVPVQFAQSLNGRIIVYPHQAAQAPSESVCRQAVLL